MKFLIDTNVVLDLLLDRMPFADDAAQLFDQAERGNISAVLCGTTVTTIFYIAPKTIGARKAKQAVGELLSLCEIAPVGRAVLEDALSTERIRWPRTPSPRAITSGVRSGTCPGRRRAPLHAKSGP